MSSKKGGKKRARGEGSSSKRRIEGWECTLCTFDNVLDAFKCAMCDTRKGTSTRKPRLSTSVQEHQQTVHNFVLEQQAQAAAKSQRRERDASRGHTTSPSPSTSSPLPSPVAPADSASGAVSPAATTPSPSLSHSVSATAATAATAAATAALKPRGRPKGSRNGAGVPASLKGVDRNSARTHAVTVHGITVVITDYKLKTSPASSASAPHLPTKASPAKTTPTKLTLPPPADDEKEEIFSFTAPLTPPVLSSLVSPPPPPHSTHS